jgi:hypothetical protein
MWERYAGFIMNVWSTIIWKRFLLCSISVSEPTALILLPAAAVELKALLKAISEILNI